MVLAAAATKDAAVRDLFERYVPDAQKVKRLGTVIRPESLLAMKGDAGTGQGGVLQDRRACSVRPATRSAGRAVRSARTCRIGKRLRSGRSWRASSTRRRTSTRSSPPTWSRLDDERQLSGLIVAKDDKALTIRDPQGKDTRVPLDEGRGPVPSKKSLMPDQLLRDLTAEQAADLLATWIVASRRRVRRRRHCEQPLRYSVDQPGPNRDRGFAASSRWPPTYSSLPVGRLDADRVQPVSRQVVRAGPHVQLAGLPGQHEGVGDQLAASPTGRSCRRSGTGPS